MTPFVDVVERHLCAGATGVDVDDRLWPELSALLAHHAGLDAAAALLDVAAALASDSGAPPAARKLVGAVTAILAALTVDEPRREELRRRAAAVVGAPSSTAFPGQAPPQGALKVGPATFAGLRARTSKP